MSEARGGALARLQALLGPAQLLTDPADFSGSLVDHRQLYRGRALALALPRDVNDVAALLRFCNNERIGVVPQGGNTSYCGGATPDESGTQLLVSLRRMNQVRSVDQHNAAMIVEAGCVLAQVQAAAQEANLLFPLSLGSEGSCQIGGNLSTNAGGTAVLRYGMMRDLVLGLEVVLADGRVLSSLSPLRKDNTGYDLKSLFIGAEGTLGIITAACLKLFPAPRSVATALVAVADAGAAVELLRRLRASSGDAVSSFELMPRIGIELDLLHIDGRIDPFERPHDWYVLVELSSSRADDALDTLLEATLGATMGSAGVQDAVLAQNERQRAAFWKLRESIPEAQRRDGASLKHDVAVPVASLPEFLRVASQWVREQVPQGKLVAYGHVGDGNLHFNINQLTGQPAGELLARGPEIRRAIHDLVHGFGGSFSAEHGIGRLKVDELVRYAPAAELATMHSIKQALDPRGILNPGKVLGPAAAP